jgi:hypothetical protein
MNQKEQEWWCIDFGQNRAFKKEVFNRLTESFFRFTPDIVQGRNRVFLEMSRTKKFFNLNTLQSRARVLGAREGVDSSYWRFGVGTSLPLAWVQSQWRSQKAADLPIESYFDFIDPLNQFELNRSMRERLLVFQSLGMKSLGSLFTVPKEAWLVRFGEEFDRFLENYEFGTSLPWSRFITGLILDEKTRWNAEEYIIDSESLIFKLKPLIERLCERLYSLRQALKKMELILKLDRPVPNRKIELNFAFPQTSKILLLKLLREKISIEMQKDALTDPIVEVEVKVLESVKRSHESERFSFSENSESESKQEERWLELISYLGLKLKNPAQAFQVELTEHPLPEKSWAKVLFSNVKRENKTSLLPCRYPKRPMKLFSEPVPIFRLGDYLKQKDSLWKVCEFSEAERIEGYEWDVEETSGFARTYYRVKVKSEKGLVQFWWIFKDELVGRFKLHGVY